MSIWKLFAQAQLHKIRQQRGDHFRENSLCPWIHRISCQKLESMERSRRVQFGTIWTDFTRLRQARGVYFQSSDRSNSSCIKNAFREHHESAYCLLFPRSTRERYLTCAPRKISWCPEIPRRMEMLSDEPWFWVAALDSSEWLGNFQRSFSVSDVPSSARLREERVIIVSISSGHYFSKHGM